MILIILIKIRQRQGNALPEVRLRHVGDEELVDVNAKPQVRATRSSHAGR